MAGRLFAEPDDSGWDLVTDVLATYDSATDWPGWLMAVGPGIAAELLDDGLAATKPRWQRRLLDIALRALSEPLPVDLSLVARGLAVASLEAPYQRVTLAAIKRALGGAESSRYAATRITEQSRAITPPHTPGQLVDGQEIRSGRVKGKNRINAYELLAPEIHELTSATSSPIPITDALEELKTLQVIEINGKTVGVRPKSLPDWAGMVAAIENPDGRAALELAVKAADPCHWRLIHLVALEVFPPLARRPVGARVL